MLVVTHDWHAARAQLCFEAVFGRDKHVKLERALVPSNPEEQTVIDRKTKEASIIASGWVKRTAEQMRNHEGMI